jgi:uncharacterized circularly permuted ATP-grasp superfamily protein
LDDKLKALFTGKDIMNLRDGIEGKDIWIIKNATTNWIIEKDFNVSQADVFTFIKEYDV